MVLYYNNPLKFHARTMRCNQTDAETYLWSKLRRKQLQRIQFYRQRPIGNYIVDFYAHTAKLVIEVDGGQHFEDTQVQYDKIRDEYLRSLGLTVLRFDNLQVLRCMDEVLEVIWAELVRENPP